MPHQIIFSRHCGENATAICVLPYKPPKLSRADGSDRKGRGETWPSASIGKIADPKGQSHRDLHAGEGAQLSVVTGDATLRIDSPMGRVPNLKANAGKAKAGEASVCANS